MKKYLWIFGITLSLAIFGIVLTNAVAQTPACQTNQDCYDVYKNSAYTCEFFKEQNGFFCAPTKAHECGGWNYAGCEGNFGVWKNSCGDINKELDSRCVVCETNEDCSAILGSTNVSCINSKCERFNEINDLENEEISNYFTYIIVGVLVVVILAIIGAVILIKLKRKREHPPI